MSKRRKPLALALTLAVLAVVLLAAFRTAEPTYKERSLTSWLAQCSATPLDRTQRLAQAQEAVRTIGASKALPTLLRLVRTKDNPVRAWAREKLETHPTRFMRQRSTFEEQLTERDPRRAEKGITFHWQSALECQMEGIAGFEVFGSNCAPAVAQLTRLLGDRELAFVAVRCLAEIGKPAEAALCQCPTNADWQVRNWSVGALATATDDIEVYISRIKPCLNDVEPSVRFSTVQALAAQSEAPELALPLLVSALQDTQDSVSSQAAAGLAGFGSNALSAWSALTNLVTNGREGQSRAALKALTALDAANALPILSNAVVCGSPSIMGTALRELRPIAPALALNLTLTELRANDARRQLVALGVAGSYDVDTPGIADALKLTAKASDPEISQRATITMREMLNKQKEKRGPILRLAGEPSYQGKPLGEWLTLWRDDSGLSANAVEALRQMGTNLIPALVARLTYRDPTFNLDDGDVGMGAARALIALGDDAKPALPALAALMDSDRQDFVLRAIISTLGTGTSAIPCLLKGFTNQFADVRSEAAHFLTEWGAQFPEQQKQAVPYVMNLLEDPDPQVRLNATNDLLELEPRAAAKAGIKRQPGPPFRRASPRSQ